MEPNNNEKTIENEQDKPTNSEKIENIDKEIPTEPTLVEESAESTISPDKVVNQTPVESPPTSQKPDAHRNNIKKLNSLFIIPSWSELLGYPTLGEYMGQKVSNIITDCVVFFTGSECSVKTDRGDLYFVFGLGYYYLKFELKKGTYITDSRILTGLVLPDFVYDHLASSSNITLAEDRDVIIAEKIIRIPLNLSYKTNNQITFIKGAIMRNIFIPNKEIILEMMDKIKDPRNFRVDDMGQMLLSAHWDVYNMLLVSNKMKAYAHTGYSNSTAGLSGIVYGGEEFLEELLSPLEQKVVQDNIIKLRNTLRALQFDPIYPYSILNNLAPLLEKDDFHPSEIHDREHTLAPKESVLLSAEERIQEVVNWPPEFSRKTIQKQKAVEEEPYPKINVLQSSDAYNLSVPEQGDDYRESHEDFELRILKNPQVETKALPLLPDSEDEEEILLYAKYVIEEDYDMPSVGKAFEMARDKLRTFMLQSDYMWEMSKYANIFTKKEANLGLNIRDKNELLGKIDSWIAEIKKEREEKARKEREEKERQERLKREEKERERKEQERLERERLEEERRKLEKEKAEMERLQKLKEEKEQIMTQRQQIQQKKEELKTAATTISPPSTQRKETKIETMTPSQPERLPSRQELRDISLLSEEEREALEEKRKAWKKKLKKQKKSVKKAEKKLKKLEKKRRKAEKKIEKAEKKRDKLLEQIDKQKIATEQETEELTNLELEEP